MWRVGDGGVLGRVRLCRRDVLRVRGVRRAGRGRRRRRAGRGHVRRLRASEFRRGCLRRVRSRDVLRVFRDGCRRLQGAASMSNAHAIGCPSYRSEYSVCSCGALKALNVLSLEEARMVSLEDLRADIIRSAARGQGPTFIAAKLDILIAKATFAGVLPESCSCETKNGAACDCPCHDPIGLEPCRMCVCSGRPRP